MVTFLLLPVLEPIISPPFKDFFPFLIFKQAGFLMRPEVFHPLALNSLNPRVLAVPSASCLTGIPL